jgi:phospholipid/cholesterol/gamma-HCH transport system substrate-binding protein
VTRAIRKHLRDFVAAFFLFVLALGVAGYILSNQRFYLPGWVPVVGTDFYELEAELSTGQAVVPGQGQTVNIAGVKVGEVGKVELEDGRAVVQMLIKDEYKRVYRDATILLRPKTGLKDMYLSLDPGSRAAGQLPEGSRVRVANTLPDVNPDEILSKLDTDTRDYLRVLLNSGGEAFAEDPGERQNAAADLRETFKRFEPTARDARRITAELAKRRTNIRRVIHNFQLLATELGRKDDQIAELVDSANANFGALAAEEASIRESLRLLPGTLGQTETTFRKASTLAAELGPTLQGLRPFARALGPSLRRMRPFLRQTTPIIRTQLRPFARDVRPTVRDLRRASEDLAVVTPRLTRTFKVLNTFLNLLAYNPPGSEEGYLFWSAWAAHAGATIFTAQDAHGPIRRGLVLISCPAFTVLDQLVLRNPQLATLIQLLNAPPQSEVCPSATP